MLAELRNCPTRPAACQVDPEVSRPRSRSRTSVSPIRPRCRAVEQPTMPPPTMTILAEPGRSLMSALHRVEVGERGGESRAVLGRVGGVVEGDPAVDLRDHAPERLAQQRGGRHGEKAAAQSVVERAIKIDLD